MNRRREHRQVPRLALTREEAAESLGVGLTTFKTQIQPHLRVVRRGRCRLFPISEIERFLDEEAALTLEADGD